MRYFIINDCVVAHDNYHYLDDFDYIVDNFKGLNVCNMVTIIENDGFTYYRYLNTNFFPKNSEKQFRKVHLKFENKYFNIISDYKVNNRIQKLKKI